MPGASPTAGGGMIRAADPERLGATCPRMETRMTQDEYAELLRRMTLAVEGINATLASLDTKHKRVDLTLIALDETTEAIRELLQRHEATFERLGRLLDERLPPQTGNGRES
jgi:hypothetical protein